MKRTSIFIALLAVAVAAFGFAGSAYAQGGTPNPGGGLLHDLMLANLAEQLGISIEDLEARQAAGQTGYQVALDLGFSAEQAIALIGAARSASLDQAVEQGLITQAQADWMRSRWAAGMAAGLCAGNGIRAHGFMGNGGAVR